MKKNKIPQNLPTLDLDFEPNPGIESNLDFEPNPQSPQTDSPKAVFRDPDNPETVINPPFTFEED